MWKNVYSQAFREGQLGYSKHNFFFFFFAWGEFEHFKFVSKISRKLFELGLEIWSADMGWWVDYLMNFWSNSVKLFQSYGQLQIWTF